MKKWVHWTFWTPKLLLNMTVFSRSITLQQHESSNTSSQHPMHSLTRVQPWSTGSLQTTHWIFSGKFQPTPSSPLASPMAELLSEPSNPWSTCMTIGSLEFTYIKSQPTDFGSENAWLLDVFLAFLCRSNWSPPWPSMQASMALLRNFRKGFWDPNWNDMPHGP